MKGFLFIGVILLIAGIIASNPAPAESASIEHIDWGDDATNCASAKNYAAADITSAFMELRQNPDRAREGLQQALDSGCIKTIKSRKSHG